MINYRGSICEFKGLYGSFNPVSYCLQEVKGSILLGRMEVSVPELDLRYETIHLPLDKTKLDNSSNGSDNVTHHGTHPT